jgi:hypothetical protein
MIPLPEPIAFANDLTVYFEPGRTYALDELPPRSNALDGPVRGPAFDTATERYSFDHHEGVIRHVTLATCEQVYDALRVGLDPRGFHVVLNDLDGDTVLSLWLLLRPEAVRGDRAARVEELVRRFGRVDALGPGWGEPHAVHAALTPSRNSKQSVCLLRGYLKIVDNWWSAGVVPRPPAREPARGFWFDASGHVVHGEVAQMAGLYEHASVGVREALGVRSLRRARVPLCDERARARVGQRLDGRRRATSSRRQPLAPHGGGSRGGVRGGRGKEGVTRARS